MRREELALKILDKDDIPQRKPGESIESNRSHLELLLMNELLNEDGTVKDRYKDDPEMMAYAQWAQKIYNLHSAQMLANDLQRPEITLAQTQMLLDKVEEEAHNELATYTAKMLDKNEVQKKAVLSSGDQLMLDAGNQDQTAAEAQSFLNLTKPG